MSTTVSSVISQGFSGLVVEIECHLSNSLPGIVIVGAGSRNVDEAKERIRGAFSSSKLTMPAKRITINLAPADIPKDGSSLDLPIAIAILKASGGLPAASATNELFIGELGLDGRLKPVRGIIGKIIAGRDQGYTHFFIPHENLDQATMVPNIKLTPIAHLRQLVDHLSGKLSQPADYQDYQAYKTRPASMPPSSTETEITLDDIIDQPQAKRVLTIAAAGGHNLLLSGPPGTGKSMLAKALGSLLPPLSHEERLEVTQLHSLTGARYEQPVHSRPIRAPHHSASHAAMVGGGNVIRPGEISLAHRGILLFDELPEFKRDTIEALRQPLEDKAITISRSRQSATFPADFIFIATANPCPCGYYDPTPQTTALQPTKSTLCDCPPALIRHYQRKLSGPLLDRIDLFVTVNRFDHRRLLQYPSERKNSHDLTSTIRLVLSARAQQSTRFGTPVKLNSHMNNHDIKTLTRLSGPARKILDMAADSLQLSARGYMRTIKVARTIADLESSHEIKSEHITEALQYRPS